MKYNFCHRFYHQSLSLFSTVVKTIARNFKNRKFEPEVEALKKIVRPGSICLDVGGAYGRYALPLCRLAGQEGKVFSFEPGRYSRRVLRIIKFVHRLNNLSIQELALSDKNGAIMLCLPVKKTGKIGASLAFVSQTNQEGAVCERVRMTTVDDFCRENAVGKVGFIKCDTEGHELAGFRGAKDTIKRWHPAILCEVDRGNMSRYGYSPDDLEKFFLAFGYKIFTYDGKGAFLPQDKIRQNANYFFFPADSRIC